LEKERKDLQIEALLPVIRERKMGVEVYEWGIII